MKADIDYVLLPVKPTSELLEVLAREIYPEDWEAGKRLQQAEGCDLVPPNSEMECAVGKYARLVAALQHTKTISLSPCRYLSNNDHPKNSRVFLHNGSSPGIDLFQVRCSCGARGMITGGKESAVAAWNGVKKDERDRIVGTNMLDWA